MKPVLSCHIKPDYNEMLVFHDLLMIAQVKEYEDVQINFNVNFKGALTFGEIEVIMDSWNQMQEQRKEKADLYESDPIHGKTANT
jgi:hypothetical protein